MPLREILRPPSSRGPLTPDDTASHGQRPSQPVSNPPLKDCCCAGWPGPPHLAPQGLPSACLSVYSSQITCQGLSCSKVRLLSPSPIQNVPYVGGSAWRSTMEEKRRAAWCWTRNYRFQQCCGSPVSLGITIPATSASLAVRRGWGSQSPCWRAPADKSTLWGGRETPPV